MDDSCLGPRFCTDEAILGQGATWVNETNFVMNHTPGTGLIALPGGLKPSVLPTELRLGRYNLGQRERESTTDGL
jgi:hypothetical protein